jgi:amino acid transporter
LIFGNAGATLVVAGTAISILGAISGEILAIPRVLFAGARDGILPKFLSAVHPKYITPHKAIIIYSALGFLFAVFGVFKQLIILSSAATLLIYLGVVLAAIKLRYKKTAAAENSFTIPGGIIVPVSATVIIAWLLSNLSKEELIGTGIFILALIVIYVLMILYKKSKTLPQDKT